MTLSSVKLPLCSQKFLQSPHSTQYQSQLSGQVVARREDEVRDREISQLQQLQHFQSWDSFWGRPGYGAPRDHTHRENLMKNLYFGDNNKVSQARPEATSDFPLREWELHTSFITFCRFRRSIQHFSLLNVIQFRFPTVWSW